MPDPGRKPPRDTLRILRQEVGFCCPVQGCGSPYLTWHHFDPPWRVEHHHRPEGMIALCRPHADQADNGAYTDDQLRELKRIGKQRGREVRGRFNWMRQDLLAVVGGSFYYQSPVIFEIGDEKCIWFDRDEEGYLQLNFKMPTIAGRPRAEIEQNFWTVSPAVDEVICPPNGRKVEVSYRNGDKFKAEFFNVESAEALESRYPESRTRSWSDSVHFPLTAVELWESAGGTPIEFGPSFSRLGGIEMYHWFVRGPGSGVAIHVDMSKEELPIWFPQEGKTYIDTEVYLTDLIDRNEGHPRIDGFTFTECRIRGPIVVYPFGGPNVFNGGSVADPIEAMLFEVPEGSSRVGIVQLTSCRFTNCEIEGMGILGTPQQLAQLRQMLGRG